MMKPQGRWFGYIVLVACLGLGACADTRKPAGQAAGGQGAYKVGKPYQVAGIWYYPAADYDYAETGIASWYGPGFHGRATANGEAYVDFSGELANAHPGGSLNEMLTVYTLVDVLTVNLPAITTVQLLIEGKEVDTLAGHVDLRRPLVQNLTWVE